MDYDKEFVPFASSLYKEFGFKYVKKDSTAILKKGNMIFEVMTCYTGCYRAMNFACYVKCPLFIGILHEIFGCEIEINSGTLIELFTDHAFCDKGGEEAGFSKEIVLSDGYPVETRLTDEQVFIEFERLLTRFILPWFERNSTLAGIRGSFKSAPLKTQTWNNLLYTYESSMETGGEFLMFYIDFMIGRLLNDDHRSAEELYRDEYEVEYVTKFDKYDEVFMQRLIELPSIKKEFEILPTMLSRLDAVTPEQWAVYRKQLGIEI